MNREYAIGMALIAVGIALSWLSSRKETRS